MFLKFPYQFALNLQQTVLVINTVLLIVALIIMELVYSEAPLEKRKHLKQFFPLFLILIGLLIYAAYKQAGKS